MKMNCTYFNTRINYPLITDEIISLSTGYWHFESDLKWLFPMYVALSVLSLSPALPSPLLLPSFPFPFPFSFLPLPSFPSFLPLLLFLFWLMGAGLYIEAFSISLNGKSGNNRDAGLQVMVLFFFDSDSNFSLAIVFFSKELVKVHPEPNARDSWFHCDKNDQNLYQVSH